nr:MAG TPA: hypothetical protein [Caudoviricetes sp.]
MSNIIGTVYKSDSKTEYTTDTYLHLNGAVLLVRHWLGETKDGYLDEWSVSHTLLSGEHDLVIRWYIYQSGHVDVTNCKYPKGFNIQALKEIIKEEINTIMPTNMGIHSLS